MLNADLTLHEAAAELGVHYMTAYRYVRLGLLPATKQGGSWRVRREDLDGFRASGGTATPHRGAVSAPWSQRLEARLAAGDTRGAWGVVEGALSSGADVREVYLDVLTPALVSIGARWQAGEIDIAVEHRATVIAMRLIGRLGPRFVRRGRSRGSIVLGAPAGETHGLPVAILADLLRVEGWEVSDLGADTPAGSFAHTVTSTDDVVAVGISVTNPDHLGSAAAACTAVREVAPGVVIVLGGRAVAGLDPSEVHGVGAHGAAASVEEFVALIEAGRVRPMAGA